MSKTVAEELSEFKTTLTGFRQQYANDGTIPQDERDYLESILRKLQDPALTAPGRTQGFAFDDGGVSATPKKAPFRRIPFRQKTPSPPKPAPAFDKVGRAEFLPPNQTTGLLLWNFQDGNAVPDGNQGNALKAISKTVKDSDKAYEIIGYTSGIGVDTAGGAKLAAARARAARELLVKNGVKAEKFVRTYGKAAKSQLKDDMQSGKPWAEGAARNRKVEILPTDNLITIPDEVVADGGGRGDLSDDPGRIKDVNVRDKLPEGPSDQTEKALTLTDFVANVVAEFIKAEISGALLGGMLNYLQIVDAWQQAQKGANLHGRAYGIKIGSAAAIKPISVGAEEVTAEQLSALTTGLARRFSERAAIVDKQQVAREISLGVETSARVVNDAIDQVEKQFRIALERKLSIRNADLVFRANIKMMRTKAVEMLAQKIAVKVDVILNSGP